MKYVMMSQKWHVVAGELNDETHTLCGRGLNRCVHGPTLDEGQEPNNVQRDVCKACRRAVQSGLRHL